LRPQRPGATRRRSAASSNGFALNLVEAGMARMPARVFAGVLVAEDGRQTAAELAELLQVSPAAISPADWRSGSPRGRWCLGVEACRAVKRER
jgi:hypothetical protein